MLRWVTVCGQVDHLSIQATTMGHYVHLAEVIRLEGAGSLRNKSRLSVVLYHSCHVQCTMTLPRILVRSPAFLTLRCFSVLSCPLPYCLLFSFVLSFLCSLLFLSVEIGPLNSS